MAKTTHTWQGKPADDPINLPEYSSRSDLNLLPASRWVWVFLAPVFLASGLLALKLAKNGLVLGIGVVLIVLAVSQVVAAIGMFRLHARGKQLRRRFGDHPWTRDYPWDPTGHSDGTLKTTIRYIVAGLVFFAVFNVPLILRFTGVMGVVRTSGMGIGHASHPGVSPPVALVVICSLISLGFLYGMAILKSWRYLKFGSSRLVFQRVPYILGESFEAQLIPGRSIGEYDKMQFTLRCIQPVRQIIGRGKERKILTVFQPLYADRLELGKGQWRTGMPPLAMKFTLPDQKELTTKISSPMADMQEEENPQPLGMKCYWELEARASIPGLDYKASFLVPIYDGAGK